MLNHLLNMRRKSVDLGIAFVKPPVLALAFEHTKLKLPQGSAFNNCGDFAAKLDGSWLRRLGESRRKPRVAMEADRSSFIGQRCFQVSNRLVELLQSDRIGTLCAPEARSFAGDSVSARLCRGR